MSVIQTEYDAFLNGSASEINRGVVSEEYHDPDIDRHLRRIGRYSTIIAREIGLPPDEVKRIELTAPLHDIGNCEVSREILNKPGRLTMLEFTEVKLHTIFGGRLLADPSSTLMTKAREIALSHHERWDGGGYPIRLRGNRIPVSGRITHIIDVFDTLTTGRSHKRAYPIDVAFDMIHRERGRDFDPDMVDTMQDNLDAFIRAKAEIDTVENMPDSDFAYSERDINGLE